MGFLNSMFFGRLFAIGLRLDVFIQEPAKSLFRQVATDRCRNAPDVRLGCLAATPLHNLTVAISISKYSCGRSKNCTLQLFDFEVLRFHFITSFSGSVLYCL